MAEVKVSSFLGQTRNLSFWGRSTQRAPYTGTVWSANKCNIRQTHSSLYQTAVCLVSAPPHVSATDCSHRQGAVILRRHQQRIAHLLYLMCWLVYNDAVSIAGYTHWNNIGWFPTWCTKFLFIYICNTFIKILYMFRALPCSPSGGLRRNYIYAASGIVTVCRWLPCAPVEK
jgi:hypothetical protein